MPEHIRGTIRLVEFFEKACIGSGWFELVKDGRKPDLGEKEQAPDPSFYIKVYRMRVDGQYVNTWIKFLYNHRDRCADFSISYRDLDTFNRVMKVVQGAPATTEAAARREL